MVLHTAAKPLLFASAWVRVDQYAAEASEEKLSKALKRKKKLFDKYRGPPPLSIKQSLGRSGRKQNQTRPDV